MNPTALLLSGLVDVRDRYIRALNGLDEAKLIAAPGPRRFLDVYRHQVFSQLEEYLSSLQATLEALEAIDPVGLSDQELLADLVRNAVANFLRLATAHPELAAHLPPGSGVREDLNFLLFRAGGLSLLSRAHESLVSVVVDRKLVWSSRSEDHVGLPVVAVSVPWVESLTPLRWPLAIHELGHYLLPDGRSARQFVDRLHKENGWQAHERLAFEEILADAVAERYCGRSFSLALAREGYLFSYGESAETGVSVMRRLELLDSAQDLAQIVPAAWNLGTRPGSAVEQAADAATNEMRALAVEQIGPPTTSPCPIRTRRAAELLALGEPVSALAAEIPEQSRTRLEEILLNERPPTHEEANELTEMVVQRALTDAEIFTAAWSNEVERTPADYVSALKLDVHDFEAMSRVQTELARQDTWLARALQSAAVHRWLESGRDREEALRDGE